MRGMLKVVMFSSKILLPHISTSEQLASVNLLYHASMHHKFRVIGMLGKSECRTQAEAYIADTAMAAIGGAGYMGKNLDRLGLCIRGSRGKVIL